MKAPQNLCLSIFICALASSALAGLFDPPAPLIQNADRSLTNQEIFNAFHSFMPETGLPSRQPTHPPAITRCGHISAGISDDRRDRQ